MIAQFHILLHKFSLHLEEYFFIEACQMQLLQQICFELQQQSLFLFIMIAVFFLKHIA